MSLIGGNYARRGIHILQMVEDVCAGKMPRSNCVKAFAAMGISAADIGAITAAASRSFTTAPTSKVTLDKDAEKHLGSGSPDRFPKYTPLSNVFSSNCYKAFS
jgi:hypothetical protein